VHEACTAAKQHAGALPGRVFPHGVSFHSGLSGGIIWQIRKVLVAALCVCAGSAAAFAPGANPGLTSGGHHAVFVRIAHALAPVCACAYPQSNPFPCCPSILWLLYPRALLAPSVPHHGGSQAEMTATCVGEERHRNAARHHLKAQSPPRYPHTHSYVPSVSAPGLRAPGQMQRSLCEPRVRRTPGVMSVKMQFFKNLFGGAAAAPVGDITQVGIANPLNPKP
jgi:hypothetical protein